MVPRLSSEIEIDQTGRKQAALSRAVSLHAGPHRCWGFVLSLGMIVLGCTGPTLTSNPASVSASADADEAVVASEPAPEPIAQPLFADDERADGMFAYTDPGELPQLRVSGETELLPLEHTAVAARVRGHVAEVGVEQRFVNNREEAIEVTYTFPLPENAAVDDMRMVIGKRTIESEVQTRAQARDAYETAREAGHTAALLEQERPNVFTQSVANIAPGETIAVEIRYLQTLTQDGGAGVDAAALERLLREHHDALASCFTAQASGWTLRYEVQVAADGQLSGLKRISATPTLGSAEDPEHADVQACVERSLRQIGWSRLSHGRSIVLELEVVHP